MMSICKHDFQGFFRSPIGYVYLGVFAAIANLVFFASCVLSSSSDLSSPFSFLLTVLLFLTPILTMRLFSEEYRQGTDRLLFTAPVAIWEIVLGKFLAALGVILCCLLLTIPWLIVLIIAGTPAWASIFGCYIAIFCATMVFLSIGLFLSSVTESQLIAAVLSFALFLGLYLIDTLSSAATGVLATVLDWFSVFTRYDTFMSAQFSFSNLIYFLSLTALFLFFTARVLERRRH
ncbi:MAG: ABC transporter permease subunit [Eubacteriales bacterium]|nr:ABC transporter permease subunit [Eubacteriales bacterium]